MHPIQSIPSRTFHNLITWVSVHYVIPNIFNKVYIAQTHSHTLAHTRTHTQTILAQAGISCVHGMSKPVSEIAHISHHFHIWFIYILEIMSRFWCEKNEFPSHAAFIFLFANDAFFFIFRHILPQWAKHTQTGEINETKNTIRTQPRRRRKLLELWNVGIVKTSREGRKQSTGITSCSGGICEFMMMMMMKEMSLEHFLHILFLSSLGKNKFYLAVGKWRQRA